MNKRFFLLFIVIAITVTAGAQSLKDALYGGKLKTDSGTVIKKGDDLSKKIDTSRKIPVVAEKTKPVTGITDPAVKVTMENTDTAAMAASEKTDPVATAKDNNKLWKEFMDASIATLKEEVMTSKKLKKGDYYIMVDYAIETDGQVTINNVYPSPENKFLEEQVKERLSIVAPKLNPVLASNGKPRKVNKRHNFTLTKL